jgi:hypothetical protein
VGGNAWEVEDGRQRRHVAGHLAIGPVDGRQLRLAE